MKLSDFSIKNYQFTLVIFFLLTAIGISAYQNIPRTEDPYFDISAFRINVIYPGADPREMEHPIGTVKKRFTGRGPLPTIGRT